MLAEKATAPFPFMKGRTGPERAPEHGLAFACNEDQWPAIPAVDGPVVHAAAGGPGKLTKEGRLSEIIQGGAVWPNRQIGEGAVAFRNRLSFPCDLDNGGPVAAKEADDITNPPVVPASSLVKRT